MEIYHEQDTKRSKLEQTINYILSAVIAQLMQTYQGPIRPSTPYHSLIANQLTHPLLMFTDYYCLTVNLISQVQNNGKAVCNYHHKIKNETIELENTFTKVKDALQMTKIRNQKILHFGNWFYRVKQQLWELHGIRIETDLPKFIKALNEFNRHNYDSYDILNEYMKHQSIDHEISEKNNIIQGQKRQIKTLEGHIISITPRLECKKIIQGIVEKFESINFEVDDLTRIHNLMVEIASIKKIPVQMMVKIVIDDMEKNYYNSVLFSDLVTKIKAEYTVLIRQQSYSCTFFEENYYCKVALTQLLNRGISQENIIDVNLIVSEIEKENLYAKNMQTNDIGKTINVEAVNKSNNYNALILDLRKYVTLDIACKEKQNELDEINKQINLCNCDKQPPILQAERVFAYTFITKYAIPYNLL